MDRVPDGGPPAKPPIRAPGRRATDRVPGIVPGVTLRPTSVDDIPMVQAWERDPANAAFVQVWEAVLHGAALDDPGQRHFVVEADGRPVGFVLLAGIGGPAATVEFRRIVIAEKDRGFGGAAVAVVLRYAFEVLGAGEVWLDVVVNNARARHVYSKRGFREDPGARLWADIAGQRKPLVRMEITRDEYVGLAG